MVARDSRAPPRALESVWLMDDQALIGVAVRDLERPERRIHERNLAIWVDVASDLDQRARHEPGLPSNDRPPRGAQAPIGPPRRRWTYPCV